MVGIIAIFIIGIIIQIWIDSRPNSQVNMLANEIAEIIKESKRDRRANIE